MTKMTFDCWMDKYKPMKNHIDTNSACEGMMFETYGPELEFVQQQDLKCVWTYIEEDGELCVVSGFHVVNRIGYFVTEVALNEGCVVVKVLED